MSLSWSDNDSQSSSRPSSADELQQYWDRVNTITGGGLGQFATDGTAPVSYTPISEGQIRTANYSGLTDKDIAATGYEALAPERVQALGGLGATRKADAARARSRALEEVAADPNFSVAQKFRATQLTDEDYNARSDAIARETEAAITGFMSEEQKRKYDSANSQAGLKSEEARRRYDADRLNAEQINSTMSTERQRAYQAMLDNAKLSQKDLEILAEIFFGGKGNYSQASSDADSFGGAYSGG